MIENINKLEKQCGWYIIIVIPVQLPGINCIPSVSLDQ